MSREIDAGVETVEIDLPAVVTVSLRLNQPRHSTLPGILNAKRKPLAVMSLAELGVNAERQFVVESFAAPPGRGVCVRATSVAELVAALRARGALP